MMVPGRVQGVMILNDHHQPGLGGKVIPDLLLQLLEVLWLGWGELRVFLHQLCRTWNRERHRGEEYGARLHPAFKQIEMVQLCLCALTWLPQLVLHRTHSLHYSLRSLLACQEFAGETWDKEEDLISRLEFTRPSFTIVCLLLLLLSHEYIFICMCFRV